MGALFDRPIGWTGNPVSIFTMSPELETLDQLLCSDLPVFVIRKLYDDDTQFRSAILAMLSAGEIRLLTNDRVELPKWEWSTALDSRTDSLRLQITETGAHRIR